LSVALCAQSGLEKVDSVEKQHMLLKVSSNRVPDGRMKIKWYFLHFWKQPFLNVAYEVTTN